jgi:uncharacterized protein (TIGR04551 family)
MAHSPSLTRVVSMPSLHRRAWLSFFAINLVCAVPALAAPSQPVAGDRDVFDEDAAQVPAANQAQTPLPSVEGPNAQTQAVSKNSAVQTPDPTEDATEGEDELTLEEWERDDWQLVRPRVALFDVSGYFRARGDLFRRLDFDNGSVWEFNGAEGVPRYQRLNDSHAQYSNASMRLRIEPRLHITDALQITSTLDIMDNVVMGSSPSTLAPAPFLPRAPVHVLSTGQQPMRRGVNSLNDSIQIKRLWARATFLSEQLELNVGRMPDHWGLGMWYNNGDCLNCDRGTVADRVSVAFRALGHTFVPMVDWVSRGPVHRTFGYWDLAPVDAVAWDNAMSYGLRVFRDDHPDDIRDQIAHHRQVVNYGLSNMVRLQSRDLPYGFYTQPGYTSVLEPTVENLTGTGESRDAVLYQGDAYAKFFAYNLELGAEVAVMAGRFNDVLGTAIDGSKTTHVTQVGAAAEATYHFREDRRGLRLDMRLGGASGDDRRGFGVGDMTDTQRGATATGYDTTLKNFQFSPDYHLDLLLFRRMLGTVTDAWYLRPEAAYRFDDKLAGRLTMIYSQAMQRASTPSATAQNGGALPLGLEIDGELAYGIHSSQQRGQLLASLAGGMLFPLKGFTNPTRAIGSQSGSFAWTIQARMFLTF